MVRKVMGAKNCCYFLKDSTVTVVIIRLNFHHTCSCFYLLTWQYIYEVQLNHPVLPERFTYMHHCLMMPFVFLLKVAYQNDQESALIQFASPEEARRAMQSTEAVLNNRFISMYWFRGDGIDGHGHSHSLLQPQVQPAMVRNLLWIFSFLHVFFFFSKDLVAD